MILVEIGIISEHDEVQLSRVFVSRICDLSLFMKVFRPALARLLRSYRMLCSFKVCIVESDKV